MTCRSPRWPSSAGQLWPPGSLRHSPVDPFEQHRQLGPAQYHHTLLSPRPEKSPALQTLGKQTQPIAVPPQQLDQIAAAAAKAEHMPGERILPEHALCLGRQTVKPLAHIVDAGRQPYPGARRQSVHRSSSITCRSVSELTLPKAHPCSTAKRDLDETDRRQKKKISSATFSAK